MSRMVSRRRIAPVAAVLLGLLLLAMGALGVVLDAVTHYAGSGGPVVDSLATAAAALPAAAVATLLAARRPRNPIGWLLFAILFVGANPSGQYDVWAYRMHPGTVPFGWVSVVVQQLWPMFLVLIAILLWVFPDGRLPGGRWRRPSVLLVVTGLLLSGAESLSGVVRVARPDIRITATGDLVGSSGFAFIFGAFIIPIALGQSFGSPANPVVNALFILSFGALPAFMGVAVLKYQLYELDRIVSRVVSYALVTALLVGVYAGLVLAATHLLPHKSAVAVAVSTLITAALFSPVRRRVQRAVDRRFNRSRYDAEALVAAFTGRLRHTVDLDAVRDDLTGVVEQAFQPTQVSIWLALPGREAVSGKIMP
jgi:hypothetical protein